MERAHYMHPVSILALIESIPKSGKSIVSKKCQGIFFPCNVYTTVSTDIDANYF